MLADRTFDLLRCADDLMTRGEIAALALRHETRPAARYEGARAGARDTGRGVDAAGPVGRDEVLVGAQLGVAVEDDGVAFRSEAVLVGVAAYAGDALEGEVEGDGGEASAGEEGDEEGAETAVDVKGELALLAEGETGEGGNVVDDAVGEIRGGADEEDGVAVDEGGDAADVDLVLGGWAGDQMDFDAEIGSSLAKGGVSCFGNDPVTRQWRAYVQKLE